MGCEIQEIGSQTYAFCDGDYDSDDGWELISPEKKSCTTVGFGSLYFCEEEIPKLPSRSPKRTVYYTIGISTRVDERDDYELVGPMASIYTRVKSQGEAFTDQFGIFNSAEGKVRGSQAGLFNFVEGKIEGNQVGFISRVTGDMNGNCYGFACTVFYGALNGYMAAVIPHADGLNGWMAGLFTSGCDVFVGDVSVGYNDKSFFYDSGEISPSELSEMKNELILSKNCSLVAMS